MAKPKQSTTHAMNQSEFKEFTDSRCQVRENAGVQVIMALIAVGSAVKYSFV